MIETEVVLAADGTVTVTDVNGGTSDDTLTFSILDDAGTLFVRIRDFGDTLSGTGTGVMTPDPNAVDVPRDSITALVIDTAAGADVVNLIASHPQHRAPG